ncbi:hypothetical protein LHYA1_G003670 [Lachnellula hyalina]|uniref:Uncharacterized protein n=1 Tax=Lachnellula hyalina TaxID=1316788 RepID=A0A8H8R4L7_9HELO|nr:uncharacterized protein LHYA1_G003670 [Lachnellula hyalina]TVY28334.1 hypothetical protein LHYA1_G003670 [Lachnellula hyalina]
MLLQKTSSRFKQFIAHRRKDSFETSGDIGEGGGLTDRNLSTNNPRRLSWLSQSPPTETATLRRTSSSARTRNQPLPPATSSASSSSSSLCSCNCKPDRCPIECSLSSPEPTPRSPEILYPPPLSSTKSRGDAETRRLIFSEPLLLSPASTSSNTNTKASPSAETRVSTFDLIEALSIDPVDEDTTPTQSVKSLDLSDMEDFSGDVDQLIRETDAAFQAVGNALEDAKAATQGWWLSSPANLPVTIPRTSLMNNPRLSIIPLAKGPTSRSVSIAKAQRKKTAKRRNILGRALRTVPIQSANAPPRWTLTDVTTNVVDVFSGKMFRTEVDEMLTPGRIQRMKEERGIEIDRKISAESARTRSTDDSTRTEPFHLESLSSRIDAARVHSAPLPSPVLPPPATPNAMQDLHMKTGTAEYASSSNSSMVINDLSFPSPPDPMRSPSDSCVPALLPSIPEVSPLTLSPTRALLTTPKPPEVRLQPVQNQDHIFLPSTPFTLTSPNFRHGPIRVERILKYSQDPSSPEPEDEPLDWTAFQMAIQGTMNDASAVDDADDEWEADEAELDDIMNWWQSFGFYGIGRLAQDAPARMRVVKDSKKKSVWSTDFDDKMLVNLEARDEDLDRSPDMGSGSGSADFEDVLNVFELDTDTSVSEIIGDVVNSPQKGHESFPSSPMVDFDSHDISTGDETPIPMGFNLGHDLGDFLSWETEHIFFPVEM